MPPQWAIKHLPRSRCVLLVVLTAPPVHSAGTQVMAGLGREFARRFLFLTKPKIFFCAPLFRKTVKVLVCAGGM